MNWSSRFVLLSGIMLTLLSACSKERFSPQEVALIKAGEPQRKMSVLHNDVPAENKLLRRKATNIDPKSSMLSLFIARLRVTLDDEGGVGIAAPQVGINKKIILVMYPFNPKKKIVHSVYLNPKVVKKAKKQKSNWEGSLSIPEGFGKVKRPVWIVMRYQNIRGEQKEQRFEDFHARIILHEIDHLKGILFIDVKEPGKLVPKNEYAKIKKMRRAKAKAKAKAKTNVKK